MKRLVLLVCFFGCMSLRSSSDSLSALESTASPISIDSDSEQIAFMEKFQNRITDLIVIADTSESVMSLKGTSGFPFPWYHYHGSGMLASLIMGLRGEKVILCSKALLQYFNFVAHIWSDFVSLSSDQLIHKYQQYASAQDVTFVQSVNAYKKVCMELQKSLLSSDGEDVEVIFYELEENDVDIESLKRLYSIYILYRKIFDSLSYVCLDINQMFVLLVPKTKLNITIDLDITSNVVLDHARLHNLDLWSGLKVSRFPSYVSDKAWHASWSDIASPSSSAKVVGNYLLHALQGLLVTIYDLQPELHNQKRSFLPSLNIFLDGHGVYGQDIMGIKQEQFVRLLKYLNHNVSMRSLGCSSCFIGGSRFKDLFSHAYHEQRAMVPSLNYPVIFIGSFADVTWGFDIPLLYKQKENTFQLYFDELHNEIPNFEQAGTIVSGLFFTDSKWRTLLSNYVSVKYPGLDWVSASEIDEQVYKLSAIQAHTKKNINIAPQNKIVLMNANSILTQLTMQGVIDMHHLWGAPVFLPMSYMNQNYCISRLVCSHVIFTPHIKEDDPDTIALGIMELLYALFLQHWTEIVDPVLIVIESMKVESINKKLEPWIVSDVCINVAQGEVCFLYGKSKIPHSYVIDPSDHNTFYKTHLTRAEIQALNVEIKKKANNIAGYEKALALKNLYELKKALKHSKKKLPKIVKESHEIYELMSQEAKDANVVHKKIPKSTLNPKAQPFYPRWQTLAAEKS